MLLKVTNRDDKQREWHRPNSFHYARLALFLFSATFVTVSGQSSAQTPTQTPPVSVPPQNANPQTPPGPSDSQRPRAGLNIVVLDPAHGGTDTGARGTGGIHESDIVLEFAAQGRTPRGPQGFKG